MYAVRKPLFFPGGISTFDVTDKILIECNGEF